MRPMDLLSSSGMGSGPASPARSDASFFSFQQGRTEDRPAGQAGEEGEDEDGRWVGKQPMTTLDELVVEARADLCRVDGGCAPTLLP